jgi:hypothetical protein
MSWDRSHIAGDTNDISWDIIHFLNIIDRNVPEGKPAYDLLGAAGHEREKTLEKQVLWDTGDA